MTDLVDIHEEGPREGLQIEPGPISTGDKINLIRSARGDRVALYTGRLVRRPTHCTGLGGRRRRRRRFTPKEGVHYTALWKSMVSGRMPGEQLRWAPAASPYRAQIRLPFPGRPEKGAAFRGTATCDDYRHTSLVVGVDIAGSASRIRSSCMPVLRGARPAICILARDMAPLRGSAISGWRRTFYFARFLLSAPTVLSRTGPHRRADGRLGQDVGRSADTHHHQWESRPSSGWRLGFRSVLKTYAAHGENGLHAHPNEDHTFVVPQTYRVVTVRLRSCRSCGSRSGHRTLLRLR
jgi:hypothetical protein